MVGSAFSRHLMSIFNFDAGKLLLPIVIKVSFTQIESIIRLWL